MLINCNYRNSSNVKLLKIKIAVFDGNLKKWPTFRDTFNSLVQNNVTYSNIEKFYYLVSSLGKTPLSIVTNVPVTSDNYAIVYTALTGHYQNKRHLATEYWSEINSLIPLKEESYSSLRKMLDVLSEILAALKMLNFPVDTWNFVLFNLLHKKLHADTRKAFKKNHVSIKLPTFEELYKFFTSYFEALSHFNRTNNTEKPIQLGPYKTSHSKAAFVTKVSSSIICPLCQGAHTLAKCHAFERKIPQDIYNFAKKKTSCV